MCDCASETRRLDLQLCFSELHPLHGARLCHSPGLATTSLVSLSCPLVLALLRLALPGELCNAERLQSGSCYKHVPA